VTFLDDARRQKPLTYPLEGPWTHDGFPLEITVKGFPFRRARWSQKCPGVLAQYRECCAHGSMHLKVVRTSKGLVWSIDHEDAFNPDPTSAKRFGRPFAHFFHDYPPGRIAKPAAMGAATWGLGRIFL